MSIRTKWIALMTAIVLMLVGMQVYYGNIGTVSAGNATPETTFDWWIYSGTSSEYYDNYAQNPTVQYTLRKGYGPEEKTIALNFLQPPPGSEQNNYTTMISSGDLPDLIDTTILAESAQLMVEKGLALELTDYVEQYMPNYVALVHANNEVYVNSVSVDDEGNEHYYKINSILDAPNASNQGYMYRRDWLVKYGTNPLTGAPFTGGFTDPEDVDSWEDDVVFPSWCDETKRAKGLELLPEWDGTFPVFISDWEWMFEIFTRAQADLGITDKYCISLYFPGFTWNGGLCSSFGGGAIVWYQDQEGKVRFGGYEESFKTYLQCMHAWYEKGWLDHDFSQRTSDAFNAIDSTSVRQGQIAMWNGQQAELGGRMDMHDGGLTEGIYAAGAPLPVNDLYGPESCQYKKPDCMLGSNLFYYGVLITPAAKDKDLTTLFSYLDQFYTPEGGLLKTVGLSKEQVAEFSENTFYADHGLVDGAYFVNADGKYERSEVLANDGGQLNTAVGFQKAPGLKLNAGVDLGYSPNYQRSLDMWLMYKNTGMFWAARSMEAMTQEDMTAMNNYLGKVLEYTNKNAADFITGKKNFDKDWEKWCTILKKYKVDQASELCQYYVDRYPWR